MIMATNSICIGVYKLAQTLYSNQNHRLAILASLCNSSRVTVFIRLLHLDSWPDSRVATWWFRHGDSPRSVWSKVFPPALARLHFHLDTTWGQSCKTCCSPNGDGILRLILVCSGLNVKAIDFSNLNMTLLISSAATMLSPGQLTGVGVQRIDPLAWVASRAADAPACRPANRPRSASPAKSPRPARSR